MDTHAIQKKKVILVITKGNWGGAQRYVYDLATNLPPKDYDVLIVCGGGEIFVEKLHKNNIRVITIPELERDIHFFQEFKVILTLIKIFKSEKPEIIHLNSSKIGGMGSLAGRLARVPKIIFTAHGWAFNEDRGFLWKLLTYTASWITAILAHSIITISNKERNQAMSFPLVSSKKISMIHISVGVQTFDEQTTARNYIKEHAGISVPNETTVIGTVGELHKNKGYVYALQACHILKKHNKKFVYFIIGEGEERTSIQTEIENLNLQKYVYLLGAIPTPTSGSQLLKAFDIFLLSSVKEGLPYVILEAGLAKVPVIATTVGGIPEILTNNRIGVLVHPKDPLNISKAISFLIKEPLLRNKLGKNLNKKVCSEFSVQKMLSLTEDLYLHS